MNRSWYPSIECCPFISSLFAVSLLASGTAGWSQNVSTLPVAGLNGPNGIEVDATENLYVASEPGKKVTRFTPGGRSDDIIFCDSPSGLDFDDHGNLVISNFFSGAILIYRQGKLDTLLKGLHHPSDVKFDRSGNLYVSEFDRNDVMVLTRGGNLEIAAVDIIHPFGLAVGTDNEVYVASNMSGQIYKISNKTKSLFATIPGSVSYIDYSDETGTLYVTCFSCNNIYKVSKNGNVSLLAGTADPGYRDGDLKQAQFDGPNSIILSKKGTLFISEFKHNRIRSIENVE